MVAGGKQARAGRTGRKTARPRWHRLDTDERRGQILAAARRQFSQRPYSSVSTADIAEAAGVTRGLVHHYFGGKRDLYLSVLRELVRLPNLPIAEGEDVEGRGGGTRVRRVWEASVDGWLELIERNAEMWFVAIGAGENGRDSELQAILDEARELTATRVLEALGLDQAGQPPELRALVRGYGGMAEEISREWLVRGRLTREQARVLLTGSLPLMIEELMPHVVAARGSAPEAEPA